MTPLERFAADADGPVLVLHDAGAVALPAALREQGHEVRPVAQAAGRTTDPPWAGVALVVTDRTELRRTVGSLPAAVGASSAVACLLTDDDRPLVLVPRPGWPRVVGISARRLADGGAWTAVHLDGTVEAAVALRELARLSVPSRSPVVATPDPVTGPLDVGVLNPIGFDPHPTLGTAVLRPEPSGVVRLEGVAGADVIGPDGASARTVAALRPHRGVRVADGAGSPVLARTVAGLAMAGVPLTVEALSEASRERLGPALHDVLAAEVDLADPLRREEHSVRLRRAALLAHAGLPRPPACSVVLCTRRPQRLDFALRQVARQRPLDLEVVVVGHGFAPDPARVADRLDGRPATVLELPADMLFGEALDAGVRATSGDVVVKMDDDDWYGRDFLVDLLLARAYSGADLVGTTAEMVHLEQLDRTIRTREPSERYARLVAGGTILVSRDLLAELGGFRPVRRFVDRQLLHSAAVAGVPVYRAHGLGYLLRRTSEGHTWDPGLDFFLDEDRVAREWEGFAPSLLLDADAADLPARPATAAGGP